MFIEEGVNCGQRSVVDKHLCETCLKEAVCEVQVPTCKDVNKGVPCGLWVTVNPLMTALRLQLTIIAYD